VGPSLNGPRTQNDKHPNTLIIFKFLFVSVSALKFPFTNSVSQCPHGLRRIWSLTARTTGSWIRIPLETLTYVHVLLSCAILRTETSRWANPPVQGDLCLKWFITLNEKKSLCLHFNIHRNPLGSSQGCWSTNKCREHKVYDYVS
jgi:hypothetical protein